MLQQFREVVVQSGKIESKIFFERSDGKCDHAGELVAKSAWMHNSFVGVALRGHPCKDYHTKGGHRGPPLANIQSLTN